MNKKTSVFCLILVLFIFLAYRGISSRTDGFQYDYVNVAPNAAITVYQTQSGFMTARGGSPYSINDEDPLSWWYGYVNDKISNWIELEWGEPKIIDKLTIIFGGNRYAVDYKIQTWNGKSWDDRIVVTGNNSGPVTHYFNDKKGISTFKLRFYITKTAVGDHFQRISEVYVFEKRVSDISNIISGYLFNPIKVFFAYLSYPFLFLIVLFMPGYVLLNLFSKSLTHDEKFALSFALTIFIILALTVLCLGTKFLHGLYFLPGLFMLSLYVFVKKKMYLELKNVEKPILFVLILSIAFIIFYNFLILKLGFQFQADYLIPWGTAKVFMYNLDFKSNEAVNYLCWWNISDKTPLLGVITIPFLKIFGDNFFIFQMISIVCACLLFMPFFILVRELFGKKIAIFAMLFFFINPYYIYYSVTHQHRWLTTYFIFLYVHFLLLANKCNSKNLYLLAGFCAGLGYMTHPIALPYIVGGLLYTLLHNYSFKRKALNLTYTLSILSIFIIPWIFWVHYFGSHSVFYLYPFSVQGGGQALISPNSIIPEFLKTPVSEILGIRLWNLLGTFLYDPKSGINLAIDLNFYVYTLTGATMLTLFFFSCYGFGKGFFDIRYRKEICCFICIPIILQVFIITGWYEPRGMMQLQTVVPLMVTLGIYGAWQFKNIKLIFVLYNFYLLEHIFVLWKMQFSGYKIVADALKGNIYLLISSFALLLWYSRNEFLLCRYLKNKVMVERQKE